MANRDAIFVMIASNIPQVLPSKNLLATVAIPDGNYVAGIPLILILNDVRGFSKSVLAALW